MSKQANPNNEQSPSAIYDSPTMNTEGQSTHADQIPTVDSNSCTPNSGGRLSIRPFYNEPDDKELLDYLRVIYKYRLMILCITIVATITTAVLNLRQPRMYQASASIVPPIDTLSQGGGLAAKLGGAGLSLMQGVLSEGNISGLYVGILESRVVSEALVDRFDLVNAHGKSTTRAGAGRALRSNTSIRPSNDGIVRITVKDREAKQAAALANAYVNELDMQNKRLYSAKATNKREFLEIRLKEIQEELSKIESLQSREVQVKEMLFELLNRECEIAKIEEAKSMPTIQILDRAVPPEKSMRRGTVQKGIMVGIVAMILGTCIAFGCEYIASVRTT